MEVIGTIFSVLFSCCKKNVKASKAKDSVDFEERVQTTEMRDDIELYQIFLQKNWYKNQSMIAMTESRLKKYKGALDRNRARGDEAEDNKFDTLASYNFRVSLSFF